MSNAIADAPPLAQTPHSAQGSEPAALADIYRDGVNIVVWQRAPSAALSKAVHELITTKPWFKASLILSPQGAREAIMDATGGDMPPELADDMSELVDIFCCLFDLERAGLRITTLGSAMCPRFHVDHVPVRLVSTYQGVATEWLPNHAVKREKLGRGSNGLPDAKSGLYTDAAHIQRVQSGDVALLKGSAWRNSDGSQHADGLVHRSPTVPKSQHRLLLTLDISD